jgi:hypothetical protein
MPINPETSKIGLVSTADIGAAAAAIIAAGPGVHGGKTVPVTGDFKTTSEIAAAVSALTGKTVKAVGPPADAWVQMLVSFGLPQVAAQDFANMFQYYDKCQDHCAKLRPLEATKKVVPGVKTLDAWLAANKQEFVDGMA